ncbi:hypothetical protein ACNHE5_07860 [Pandoraea pnomenusa]|uniref:hypothetical protein n=1 Tax=Pandoraea TaxID=93217 RepID=UPI0011854E7D|nr:MULTISPECIES: hypothetical protein [Pandoraea]
MQLKNDAESLDLVDQCVIDYYRSKGRYVKNFLRSRNDEWGTLYSHYLVDRKTVVRVSLGQDRGIFLTGIQIGIGPHYFSPSEFWSFEDADRFRMEASVESVLVNLSALDDFIL